MNKKLVLLTDNPVKTQKIKVERSDLSSFFDEIIFTNSANTEKPEKKAYDLCQKVRLKNERSIMVGDHLYRDIFGALDNNFKFAFLVERK